MSTHDSTPTLPPELELDLFDSYPEEVLECEWNPALQEVLRLRARRLGYAEPQPLHAYPYPPDPMVLIDC